MRFVLAFAVLLTIPAPAQTQTHLSQRPEQTTFGLGDLDPVVRHPVPLTPAELAALTKDELMQQEMDQDPPIRALTGEGLEASVVHLFNRRERDLVIIGSGLPFIGADIGPFWIVRDLPEGPIVVLHALTLSLEVLGSRTHSIRDISASSANASTNTTTVFHFNGTKYVVVRTRTRPNGS
jgi:hypothetical protein